MWEFKNGLFEEKTGQIVNPGRGWYQLYSFSATESIHPEELKWSLDAQDALALVMIDIGAYKGKPIDAEGLANIRSILEFFSKAEKDMILRIVYDREGKGLEREPAFFSQIIEHIRQVGPIVSEYAEHTLIVQGFLLGSWGEMHSSRYLTEDKLLKLKAEWSGATGEPAYRQCADLCIKGGWEQRRDCLMMRCLLQILIWAPLGKHQKQRQGRRALGCRRKNWNI